MQDREERMTPEQANEIIKLLGEIDGIIRLFFYFSCAFFGACIVAISSK